MNEKETQHQERVGCLGLVFIILIIFMILPDKNNDNDAKDVEVATIEMVEKHDVEFEIVENVESNGGRQFTGRIVTDATTEDEFFDIKEALREQYKGKSYDSLFFLVHEKGTNGNLFGQNKGTIAVAYTNNGQVQIGEYDKDYIVEVKEVSQIDDTPEVVETDTETPELNSETFEDYASTLLLGRVYINQISLDENKGFIEYFSSYEDYIEANPKSGVKEESFINNFNDEADIEKILVGGPARLLREFPTLDSVAMKVYGNGNTYSVDLTRQELNDYLGFNVEDLSTTDGSWTREFANKYIYTKQSREQFYQQFVEVNQ